MLLLTCILLLAAIAASADLRQPGWYDPNGAGRVPDWHYRVPVLLPPQTAPHATVRFDVDFNALLDRIGVSATVDSRSPRMVGPDGRDIDYQQFTDTVYQGAGDPPDNGRGEIRFLAETSGSATCYLYFDIVENGIKPAWDAEHTINGNFEFSADGQQDPPGWDGYNRWTYDARAISDRPGLTVAADSGVPATVVTDETARTGRFCYLLGARDRNERFSSNVSASLERTIRVPSTNPGRLRLRYRVKGWDSSADNASQWDFLRIYVRRGGSTRQLVGPDTDTYTVLPYSPNLGTESATGNRSGYGQYNGWDTDLNGDHHAGMTQLAPRSEPWFEVSADLSGFAGRDIDLVIQARNSTSYKTWFHIDDVEWSVLNATLGAPQGFGVNIELPNDTAAGPASLYHAGDRLALRVRVDAAPRFVTARLVNPLGASFPAVPIRLFDDGSHGDGAAGDGIWTNDGGSSADPTYLFSGSDFPGSQWQVVVQAPDHSAGTLAGVQDGLAHIPDQPLQPVQENFHNIDQQVFTLVTPANLTLLKSVMTESDPANGATHPKAIPGATLVYDIQAGNQGGSPADPGSVTITDPIAPETKLFVGDLGAGGSGPVAFLDGSTASGLTYTFIALGSTADDVAFSNDNGNSFTYTPVPDGLGYDTDVTHIRITPKGAFNAVSGTAVPTFTVRFRVGIR